MDKEKLIKHHFWILLGLALLLLPVALGAVWMGVADATAKQAQTVKSKQDSLNLQKPMGENFVQELEKQRQLLDDSKGTVWKVNAGPQASLIKWPRALTTLDRLYFGDQLTDDDRTAFKRKDVYENEFDDLAELVKPTVLAGGNWQSVLRFVKFGAKFPSNEDCWLALEDLCIQREMLMCVREVNLLLARFWDETAKSEKELKEHFQSASDEAVFRFVSPYWQLDLALAPTTQGKGNEYSVRGRLTNKSHRRLNVARIDFMVSMTEGRAMPLSVDGPFLGYDQFIDFKDKRLPGGAVKPNILSIEQKLDARFVPVKRIEQIKLGYHSHRTADKPLVMGAVSEEEKKKTANAPPEGADPNAPPAAAGAEKSTSGIDRLRYLTVTKQVRRMPIGLVLIVDQAHVQDILRAFANSRLHFQTTQVHLTRNRGQGTGAMPPMPGPGGAAAAAGGEDSNTNLVEVAVYGLASIYEKFPPKPAEGATPDANNPAAAPATNPPANAPPAPAPGTPEAPKETKPPETPPQPKVG